MASKPAAGTIHPVDELIENGTQVLALTIDAAP